MGLGRPQHAKAKEAHVRAGLKAALASTPIEPRKVQVAKGPDKKGRMLVVTEDNTQGHLESHARRALLEAAFEEGARSPAHRIAKEPHAREGGTAAKLLRIKLALAKRAERVARERESLVALVAQELDADPSRLAELAKAHGADVVGEAAERLGAGDPGKGGK